jgi:hypothetical protein
MIWKERKIIIKQEYLTVWFGYTMLYLPAAEMEI